MNLLRSAIEIQNLGDGTYSLGVPTYPEDSSILINNFRPEDESLKSRVAVSKTGNSLHISREDIFPLQITQMYEKRRVISSLKPEPVSITGMRKVLMIPESDIIAHCDGLKWHYDVLLNDPETGQTDFNDFMDKIVHMALAKQDKLN